MAEKIRIMRKRDQINWSKEKALDLREIFGSDLGPVAGYPEIFRDIPQSLQENSKIVPLRGFLPNPFQFIIQPSDAIQSLYRKNRQITYKNEAARRKQN
jgi:hypothetical protein